MSKLPTWQDILTIKTLCETEKKWAEFNYIKLVYKWRIEEDSPNCVICNNCDGYQRTCFHFPMSSSFCKRFKMLSSTNIPCPDISLKIIILGNKPGNQNTLNVIACNAKYNN